MPLTAANRYKILCVDDEPEVIAALAMYLGRRYEVQTALSGTAALEMLRTSPDTAVIVSDMRMPEMSGAEFLAASRKLVPAARRILLTGHCDVNAAIAAVNQGRIQQFLSKPCESAAVLEVVESAIADYDADMLERSAIRRIAEHTAGSTDRVTGLASREQFLDCLDEALSEAELADGAGGAAFLVVINRFPDSVDECDVTAVEDVMRLTARRLKQMSGDAVCVARWDSHKFAILKRSAVVVEALARQARSLADALVQPLDDDTEQANRGVNVGVVGFASGVHDPRTLMHHAELAAREAKQNGDIGVSVFTPESNARAEYRRELLRALRAAVSGNQLTLYYQPIVDIRRNCIHAIEALARWEHADLGFVSPATFIPLAEESGLIVPLGEWVLRQACREVRSVLGPQCPRVAVNVSVMQIRNAEFVNSVHEALTHSGLRPDALELEVTESVFAKDIDSVRQLLEAVRKLGVHIAIDDFGAGYSSLAYLSQLPVTKMKVDGVFVRNFDKGGKAIVEAAIDLAHKLGFELVVEAVENEAILRRVGSLGANLIQGFHFARPMPMAALQKWLHAFHASPRHLHEPLRA